MLAGDSTYSATTVMRPACHDPIDFPSDTLRSSSIWRVRGDTLTLFTGEGTEIEQWYNGRVYPDSVVQLFIEEHSARHYVRRRAGSRKTSDRQ